MTRPQRRRPRCTAVFFTPFSILLAGVGAAEAQTILVKPYLQPGDGSALAEKDVKVVRWITDPTPGEFTVEYGPEKGEGPDGHAGGKDADPGPMSAAKVERIALDFKPAAADGGGAAPRNLENLPESERRVAPAGEQHYFRYSATLADLPPDARVRYRVKLADKVVRDATFRTRASRENPIRFVAVGDLADGNAFQNAIAFRISRADPDFMVLLGDIVYPQGRVSQYMAHFWPTYCNADAAGPTTGAPLMASVPFYPALGNHDVAARLGRYPDALGAYCFFSVPGDGPGEGPWSTPPGGDPADAATFRAAAGGAWPSIGFYSFDDGPAHLLVLDSADYVPVGAPHLIEWIERDLTRTKARWKFVCFHAPAFHTSPEHFTEQKMRLLEPTFEKCGVDVVFAGHVHNYQRSKPLHFVPKDPSRREPRGTVSGTFTLDEHFDGVTNLRPEGVIHVVAGGGGAHLYQTSEKTTEAVRQANPQSWAPFTARSFSGAHCFTVVELSPDRFQLRAVTDGGDEIDRISIEKPAK